MVKGLELFRERFRQFEGLFSLVGLHVTNGLSSREPIFEPPRISTSF